MTRLRSCLLFSISCGAVNRQLALHLQAVRLGWEYCTIDGRFKGGIPCHGYIQTADEPLVEVVAASGHRPDDHPS